MNSMASINVLLCASFGGGHKQRVTYFSALVRSCQCTVAGNSWEFKSRNGAWRSSQCS